MRLKGLGLSIFMLVLFSACLQDQPATAIRPFNPGGKITPNRPEQKAPYELSVLTYNVWGPITAAADPAPWRFSEIGRALHDFDIVALQAAWTEEASEIANMANFPFEKASACIHCVLKGTGLITLSRIPILQSRTFHFNRCVSTDCLVSKGVLFTRLQSPDGDLLDVYNVHLNGMRFLGQKDIAISVRRHQLKQLQGWIAKNSIRHGIPYLVMGDFGVAETSPDYALMRELMAGQDLLRAQESWDRLPAYTYNPLINDWLKERDHLQLLPARLDYLWWGSHSDRRLEVQDSSMIFDQKVRSPDGREERYLSDHFALQAKISVK